MEAKSSVMPWKLLQGLMGTELSSLLLWDRVLLTGGSSDEGLKNCTCHHCTIVSSNFAKLKKNTLSVSFKVRSEDPV